MDQTPFQAPVYPPVPEMMPPMQPMPMPAKSDRGMWVAIAIIVVVLASVAYAWMKFVPASPAASPAASPSPSVSASPSASATPDITANWKTYTSNALNISFKYPADWVVTENNNYPGSAQGNDELRITKGSDVIYTSAKRDCLENATYCKAAGTWPSFSTISSNPDVKGIIDAVVATVISNATAGWKTYTNAQYGYEFRYPIEATPLSITDLGNDAPITNSSAVVNVWLGDESPNVIFSVEVRGNESLTTTWIGRQYDNYYHPATFSPSPQAISLAGATGYKLIKGTIVVSTNFPQGTPLTSETYYIQKTGGPIIGIRLVADPSNQILSTFKFTK